MIKRIFKITIAASVLCALVFSGSDAFPQGGRIYLKGRVYDKSTKKPVEQAAVIVVQEKTRVQTRADGSYQISVSKPGVYNIIVRFAGYKQLRSRITIAGDSVRDFFLTPSQASTGVTIHGERELQKVSRRTMTVDEIKEVPASFGDSLNALTSLPGIMRTAFSFFGPLVIRGMYPDRNRYYIDGMPINNPMHFGGFHSVISNDLMSEIDLYASSFPVKFGGPLAAVIDINTLDKVPSFGGYADISAISANLILKVPITKKVEMDGKMEDMNTGYVIAAARYGYIALFVPIFYELVFGSKLESAPEYWDYQLKFKYSFNSNHSISLLLLGSRDFMNILSPTIATPENGLDPLINGVTFENEQMFHNQGLYYNFRMEGFKNTLMLYSSITTYHTYINMSNVMALPDLKNYSLYSNPYIFGLKDNFSWDWWKGKAELRGNVEFTIYNFVSYGKVIYNNRLGGLDLMNLKFVDVNVNSLNGTIGAYIDNKFTFGGFIIDPGVRIDYMASTNQVTVDPRLMASYEFPTKTTISLAGGMYSSFFQVNPFQFLDSTDIVNYGAWVKPERAVHSVLGLEQKISFFTLTLEGFYNYLYDLFRWYSHYENGEFRGGQSSGEMQTYGIEFMVKKDRAMGESDFFGWVSYTWTQSKQRSGISGLDLKGDPYDPNWNKWITYGNEIEHALKIVFGYKYKEHTISARFQLYTSFPYTPIIDSNPPYGTPSPRYVPVYSPDVNSAHSDIDHRLDIRYSHRTTYSWGHVNWYIEIINIYGFLINRYTGERWRSNYPYIAGVNPSPSYSNGMRTLTVIPNFGVEVKF